VLEAAPVVTRLLSGAPELRVLATSRVLLHLSGEHEYRVPPLSQPLGAGPMQQSEAVQLFAQAARAARPDFVLTEANQAAVAAICARLDGLPLAIELAAARIRLFAPEALLAQLANRLEALTGHRRDLPARQQTLRETFDWSYALLAPAERGFLAALGVFTGSFTPQAVAAVWPANQSPAEVPSELEALHESGLVERVDGPCDEVRFRLLETVREYALARLAESGEVDAARQRHAVYYLTLAERTEPALQGAQQLAELARLEADYPNLSAALEWLLGSDRADDALRLGSALWPYWLLRGLHHEAHARTQEVLAHPDAARRTAARARALLALGGAHQLRLEPAAARPVLEEALGLSRELGDPSLIAQAQQYLGLVVGTLGDYVGSGALLEASLATWRERGDRWNSACTLYYLAAIPLVEGRHDRAQALYEEAVAEFEAAGDRLMLPNALRRLGHLALRQGDHARAATWYGECLARSLDIGDRRGTLASLVALAGVVAMRGRLAEAVGLLGAAEAQLEAHQVKLFPLDQAQYDRLVSELGRQLDGAAFAAAWAAGRAMTLAQATAAAMEIS
jgi:predicted ATPase